MPKTLFEIRAFSVGTIMVPDATDMPDEAALYSLNIDSVTEDGKLKGVPSDLTADFLTIGGTIIHPKKDGDMNYIVLDGLEHIVTKTSAGYVVSGVVSFFNQS
tara:strand:- start:341 stop:649 length:309 start_codon:yes stop_codon:yes gene_type:complete